MNKLLIAVLIFGMTGCTDARVIKEQGAKGDVTLYTYFVKGIPLKCIHVRADTSALSCNWNKYNDTIAACKERRLDERTVFDKNGKEIVFPPVEGECGE